MHTKVFLYVSVLGNPNVAAWADDSFFDTQIRSVTRSSQESLMIAPSYTTIHSPSLQRSPAVSNGIPTPGILRKQMRSGSVGSLKERTFDLLEAEDILEFPDDTHVVVNSANSPNDFCISLCLSDQFGELFDALTYSMTLFYESLLDQEMQKESLEIGAVCAARSHVMSEWRRARINRCPNPFPNKPDSNIAEVFFVDEGIFEKVNVRFVKKIQFEDMRISSVH